MQKKHIPQLLLFLYLLLVVVISVVPLGNVGVPSLNKMYFLSIRVDVLLHVLIFIPLVPLWHLGRPGASLWLLLFLAVLIAFFAEFIHYLLPYRSFDTYDMIANIVGVFPGFLGVWLWKTFANRPLRLRMKQKFTN